MRDQELERYIRSRHEHINKRLRQYAVLRHTFIQDPAKHSVCFLAVANITQLAIVFGET